MNEEYRIIPIYENGARCYVCGRTDADTRDGQLYRGFYGQVLCGQVCADVFVKRMHRSQDDHANGRPLR